MKEIKIDLGFESNKIEIVPLGDLHIGDEFCRLDLIQQAIDYIKNTPNCYTILNGDLMNNALKSSKSDSYRETMTMEQQQDKLIELLTPIKNKILVMTQGNHEYRTNLLVGVDPLRYVARSLGLLENGRYADNSYLLTLRFGKRNGTDKITNTYTIFGIHGVGGGRRIGSSANALEDMGKIVCNADLYIHSHTHNTVSFKDCIYVYNSHSKKLEKHSRLFYNTNSFVDYGGYAERKCYTPSDLSPSTISIVLKRDKGTMTKITNITRI